MASPNAARIIAVSLALHGHDLDPARVTAALLLEPHRASKRDQVIRGRDPAPIGYWILKSEAMEGSTCEEHIAWLLDRLDRQEAIPGDVEGVDRVAVSCLWSATRLLTGPTFSPDLLRRLGGYRLPLEITFDYYRP